MAIFKKTTGARLDIALGCIAAIAAVIGSSLGSPALADPLALAAPSGAFSIFDRVLREPATPQRSATNTQDGTELPAHLRRQVVDFRTTEAAGTVIVDTPNTYLYYVLGGGKAIRYGIGVGRSGFTWAGVKTVTMKKEWPDWRPPDEMLRRKPELPHFMPGGPENPLGARALYLGDTLYRIHGSNEPWTIGTQVSSGCIRMRNEDVIDLYDRVPVGARVIVI